MSEDIKEKIETMGAAALSASRVLATLGTDKKNQILLAMADQLLADAGSIIEANKVDISAAEENGLTNAMIDRLMLDESRVEYIANGIRQVASLPDPVGQIMDDWERPNGMQIRQIRVPIGVIGIIYEARPNVTADYIGWCVT